MVFLYGGSLHTCMGAAILFCGSTMDIRLHRSWAAILFYGFWLCYGFLYLWPEQHVTSWSSRLLNTNRHCVSAYSFSFWMQWKSKSRSINTFSTFTQNCDVDEAKEHSKQVQYGHIAKQKQNFSVWVWPFPAAPHTVFAPKQSVGIFWVKVPKETVNFTNPFSSCLSKTTLCPETDHSNNPCPETIWSHHCELCASRFSCAKSTLLNHINWLFDELRW